MFVARQKSKLFIFGNFILVIYINIVSLKLLEYDMITRQEKVYSLSDPLLSLWLDRR